MNSATSGIKSKTVIVLRAPGTNCDFETAEALTSRGYSNYKLTLKELLDSAYYLQEAQGLILPGGFTYGDYLGSGVILSFLIRFKLMDKLMDFIEAGGKILGICNGFQILTRLGLLPFPGEEACVSLEPNSSGKFECRWTPLINNSRLIENFSKLPSQFYLPVAHMEGRIKLKHQQLHYQLKQNDQIAFYYGQNQPTHIYPDNPNGSDFAIAGITDPQGKVLGMMPHPERFIYSGQYPWKNKSVNFRGADLIDQFFK
ncbi:MAG: phosphoribosylformylglycinamidine synthase I [bacterium]